jgi:hypothetical protein
MGFTRAIVRDGNGLQREQRAGDGLSANYVANSITADANSVITVAMIAGGLVLRSGALAGRTDTSDTAANILAANPGMDIGDSVSVIISNTSTQTITLAGGTDVTASGRLALLTLTRREVVFIKTSATEMDMIAI